MKEDALIYHDKFRFNVTKILSERNQFNLGRNIYKHPGHKWEHLEVKCQARNFLTQSSWDKISGIGAVLGYNNLRALDIDDCNDIDFIKSLLKKMGLPQNYEWVVRSGSKNGFHILFYAEDNWINDSESLKVAYGSNKYYKNIFRKIEFRWKNHIILPPSNHESGNKYEFYFNKPDEKPLSVNLENIIAIIEAFCLFYNNNSNNAITKPSFLWHNPSSSEADDTSSSEEDVTSSSEEDDSSSSEEDDSSSSEEEDSSFNEYGKIYSLKKHYLFFDTETTGLPRNRKASVKDVDNWPRLVQIAWILSDSKGTIIKKANYVIKPKGFQIPFDSTKIHGITNNYAIQYGLSIKKILKKLKKLIKKSDYLVAHNMSFDEKTIGAELIRAGFKNSLDKKVKICTMEGSTNYCKIPGSYGYKWPTLSELYYKLFKSHFPETHNAENDIKATFKCFWELKRIGEL